MSDEESNVQNNEKVETICLDQFLKTCGVATGGQAKFKIQSGLVLVNGQLETKRRRKLRPGDQVTFDGNTYLVEWDEEEAS